jgi:hypothetical protein
MSYFSFYGIGCRCLFWMRYRLLPWYRSFRHSILFMVLILLMNWNGVFLLKKTLVILFFFINLFNVSFIPFSDKNMVQSHIDHPSALATNQSPHFLSHKLFPLLSRIILPQPALHSHKQR